MPRAALRRRAERGAVDLVTAASPSGADNARVSQRAVWIGVVLVAAAWQARNDWRLRPVHPPDGEIAPRTPIQGTLDSAASVQQGHWQLRERASYDITARILSREDYHFDALSDLIPEDLALGWGVMSDNRMLAHFDISQGGRFYSWQSLGALPIPRQEVVEHSANTHVIPLDREVHRELARLRVGQVVHLTGTLVDGQRDDGTTIRTSLTRSDEGPGACEIMLVESVEVVEPDVADAADASDTADASDASRP